MSWFAIFPTMWAQWSPMDSVITGKALFLVFWICWKVSSIVHCTVWNGKQTEHLKERCGDKALMEPKKWCRVIVCIRSAVHQAWPVSLSSALHVGSVVPFPKDLCYSSKTWRQWSGSGRRDGWASKLGQHAGSRPTQRQRSQAVSR